MQKIENKRILVTGGIGFIGTNVADYFGKNNKVLAIDDASRPGVEHNLSFLESQGIEFKKIDITNIRELRGVFSLFNPEVVIHMAAQVAVTTSIDNPIHDFISNVKGTLNLLELARLEKEKPLIIFASTNKVYGEVGADEVALQGKRYGIKDFNGFSEDTPLSFGTPYGCSKGSADQYVLDYYKTYQVPTVVLRQSCIYGPHQFGIEDQGWLAWFCILAHFNKPITIYGDGYQVRDVLYVDELTDVIERCISRQKEVQGEVFNIGGGVNNCLSPNELVELIKKLTGKDITVKYDDWRPLDQKMYISDIEKAQKLLDWIPKVSPEEGVQKYLDWIDTQKESLILFKDDLDKRAKYDLSIIVPAKNEAECLKKVLDEISLIFAHSAFKCEVIVVNDRSTDETPDIARRYDFVKLIDSTYPPGKGGALRSGFDVAQGDYFLMMDADYSHDAADIPDLLSEVKKHKGLVVGSRIIGGSEEYTRVRAFGNIIFTWFFGFLNGRYLSDALNGFKIFHRDVYNSFEYTANNFEIEIELLSNTLRLKREITEVPSRERIRFDGKIKSSVVIDGTRFLFRIIQEKFRTPKTKTSVSDSK